MNKQWIPVADQMPDSGKPVLVAVDRGKQKVAGRRRYLVTRAMWVARYTEEDTDGASVDADERDGVYYWPEGWYEWNLREETHWWIGGEEPVTHWRPLPQGPGEE